MRDEKIRITQDQIIISGMYPHTNGNTYHFNGSGGHADVWHGLPAAEGGGDFSL